MKKIIFFLGLILSISVITNKITAQTKTPNLEILIDLNKKLQENTQKTLFEKPDDQFDADIKNIEILLAKSTLTENEYTDVAILLGFENKEVFKSYVKDYNEGLEIFRAEFSKNPVTKSSLFEAIKANTNATNMAPEDCKSDFNDCVDDAFATSLICITASAGCGPVVWMCGGACIANQIREGRKCNKAFKKCKEGK